MININDGGEYRDFPVDYMRIMDGDFDTEKNHIDALNDLINLPTLFNTMEPNLHLPTREMITKVANKCGIATNTVTGKPIGEFVAYVSTQAQEMLNRKQKI